MSLLASLRLLIVSVIVSLNASVSMAMELVMVESPTCHICAQWNAEIAPIYLKTPEGKFAPLRRVDIKDRDTGINYASRPYLTPTFVLIDDDTELARIEGYGGDEMFWAMLTVLLRDNTAFNSSVLSSPDAQHIETTN